MIWKFTRRIIIHVPDKWKPELYENNCGEKVLQVTCFGDTWRFLQLINSEKISDTAAPCFYVGSMNKKFLEWEYDDGDTGYYKEYKRELKNGKSRQSTGRGRS